MGTTLQNGVYLPNEGERNCYAGLKTNWEILDQKVADVTALQQAVAGALHREIVESLPTTDIDPNTIYMILSGTSATENVYNEYMYVNNAWELIGTSATDLTNYYTKAEVDGKLLLKASASDLTSHTGDTTIHVTTADKTKWNNGVSQAFVFRYSSTALVASSTNSNALLDNTDNLKVGDKVIDSSGVLFSITAIDTVNSTFTVGSALIDLALDANVVHTSGDETVDGVKTFSSGAQIYNANSSNNTPSIFLRTSKVSRGSTTDGSDNISLMFNDSGNSLLSSVRCTKLSNGTTQLRNIVVTMDTSNNIITFETQLNISKNGDKSFIPSEDNNVSLGKSGNRWKNVQTNQINGLTPSSLSLPSDNLNDIIDISSYLVNLDGTANNYTAPANGWISITMGNSSGIQAYITGLWGHQIVRPTAGGIRFLMPILKDKTANILIFGGTIDNARFIPCQGNV